MASHVPRTQAQNTGTVQHAPVLLRVVDRRMVQSEYRNDNAVGHNNVLSSTFVVLVFGDLRHRPTDQKHHVQIETEISDLRSDDRAETYENLYGGHAVLPWVYLHVKNRNKTSPSFLSFQIRMKIARRPHADLFIRTCRRAGSNSAGSRTFDALFNSSSSPAEKSLLQFKSMLAFAW